MSQDEIEIDPGVPAPSDAPAVPDAAPAAIETQTAAAEAIPAAVDAQTEAPESTPDAVESQAGASEASSAALETEADASGGKAGLKADHDDREPETPADAGESKAAVPEAPSDTHAADPDAPAAAVDAGTQDDALEAPPAAAVETPEEALAVAGEPVETGPSAELKAIVEALIFASPEPITPRTLFKLLADEPKEDVTAAVQALKADYENRAGLQLVEVAGGYQIVTRPELHDWVRRLFHERSTQKLTVQALETLAVIAYKQPITAAEIAEIRGVNTSGVLSTLLERHLIKIVGRKNVVGRPFLYSTTKEFLIRFGLKDLGDLPRIEDMAEALGFDPPAGLIERTPSEEILPLDEPGETGSESQAPAAAEVTTAGNADDAMAASAPEAVAAAEEVTSAATDAAPSESDASQDRRPDERPEET